VSCTAPPLPQQLTDFTEKSFIINARSSEVIACLVGIKRKYFHVLYKRPIRIEYVVIIVKRQL